MTNQPNNTPLTPEEKAEKEYPYNELYKDQPIARERYQSHIKELRAAYLTGFKGAQSRIAELERENEKLKDENLTLNVYNHSRKIENKTLMGLLEEQFRESLLSFLVRNVWKGTEEELQNKITYDWQSYCKEHNLNPPKEKEQS